MAQRLNNLFEKPRERIWNLFCHHLEGSSVGAFLVVSSCALSDEAQTALLNSSKALGYGTSNTTFFTLHPEGTPHPEPPANARSAEYPPAKGASTPAQASHSDADTTADTATNTNNAKPSTKPLLTPPEIFRVIESLDPLCIVITDDAAAKEVAGAFHVQLEIERFTTLLGHYCCCFSDFERMLSLEKTKQQAWALLKTLKH